MLTNDEILKKIYDTPNEYVLEILEESEETVFEELYENIPEELRHQFNKYIEIHTFISEKQVEIAYYNGRNNGFEEYKEIFSEKLENINY